MGIKIVKNSDGVVKRIVLLGIACKATVIDD